MRERIGNFLKSYKQTHFSRSFWVSPKWRLFIVLAVMATMLLTKDYLENKYLAEFDQNPLAYAVLDKSIYWFGVGIVVGAAAIFLMFEGEFAIGVWRHARRVEEEAVGEISGGAMQRAVAKEARQKRAGRAVARKRRK